MKKMIKGVVMAIVAATIHGTVAAETPSGSLGFPSKGSGDEVLISVNGKTLTRSALDADVEKIVVSQGDKVPVAQKDYMRKMVRDQIAQSFLVQNALMAKVKSLGIVVTDADRSAREKELIDALSKRPTGAKSFEEYLSQYPLGKKRAMEEFENGILIDKLIKAEVAKSPTEINTKDATQKLVNEVLLASDAKVADEFKQLLPKDEAAQKKQ